MNRKLGQPGFARRVVACYLFFCMVAVAWLSLGVLTTARGVLSSRATGSVLSKLSQLTTSIEMDFLRNHGENVQAIIEQAANEDHLAFCAIAGSDARYVAHSTRPLVGAPVLERAGSQVRWGAVEGIRYTDEVDGTLSEYRVPLSAPKQGALSLRMGIDEPGLASVLGEVTDTAPFAVLLPLACVVIGAVMLRRLVGPFSAVHERLTDVAGAPYDQTLPLAPVDTHGPASTGWNRLVERFQQAEAARVDATDSRIAEALATRRRSKSLDVLQALGEGIAVTDVEGRIEFANAAVAALLDAESPDDLDRLPIGETLSAAAEGADKVLETAPQAPVVAELTSHGDGVPRVLRVERQPLGEEDGRNVWSIRDITQQKLAEKSRDQFIDAATHELRTPLANIKAYAEMLATCDVDDPEQQKDFFNTINTEATRLGRFVDDLLDISSMEVGTLTIRRQNVEVERLLREAAEKVRPLTEKKSQQLEVVVPPKLGEMHLDKDKVSALLVNLLGNASKYTPEGGAVRFKAEPTDTALAISIQDTGVGISADELPRVFEKFFRSENPKVRNEAGTGLGLSLAREIARLHGGDVTAESEIGEGSTFTVTLPRSKQDSV